MTTPYKEIKRFIMIKELAKKLESKFKLKQKYNIVLTDLFLNETDKSKDPILSIITSKTNLPDEIVDYINKKVLKIISKLNSITNKIEQVEVSNIGKYIVLMYKKIKYRINKKTYDRIRSQIIDTSFSKSYTLETILWMLYHRYYNVNLFNNLQGAVHPKFYKQIKEKFKSNVEGFGSFFNHLLKYYCGLFPDLEKYFGCLGNFFTSELTKKFYVVNPPFWTDKINQTINHVLSELDKRDELTILLILPAWLTKDRQKLNKVCNQKLEMKEYQDELNYEPIFKSKYLKQYLLYCKSNFVYYDYIGEKDCCFTPSNLILLSNYENPDMEKIFGKADAK